LTINTQEAARHTEGTANYRTTNCEAVVGHFLWDAIGAIGVSACLEFTDA
jgi:hypothetical protein